MHSADCERAFNYMKMVKSDTWSRLGQKVLTSLLRVQMNSPETENFDREEALRVWVNCDLSSYNGCQITSWNGFPGYLRTQLEQISLHRFLVPGYNDDIRVWTSCYSYAAFSLF